VDAKRAVLEESGVCHVFTCIYPACFTSSQGLAMSHIIRTIQRVTYLQLFKNIYIAVGH